MSFKAHRRRLQRTLPPLSGPLLSRTARSRSSATALSWLTFNRLWRDPGQIEGQRRSKKQSFSGLARLFLPMPATSERRADLGRCVQRQVPRRRSALRNSRSILGSFLFLVTTFSRSIDRERRRSASRKFLLLCRAAVRPIEVNKTKARHRRLERARRRSVSRTQVNDPSAGSPTETLLRLLLPLSARV